MRIEFPPSLHGTSLAAGNGSEQQGATPQRAAEEVLGGGLGGGESGFCDGQADPETGGRLPRPGGARGTVVQWFRCMDYPSGGSRYQWRQPQRMAWLKGSYHGGQWRPPRTFLQLTRSPWETHVIGVWQRGQRGVAGDSSAGFVTASGDATGTASSRARSVWQRSR